MTTDSSAWYDFFGPDYDDESPRELAEEIAQIGGLPAFTALFHRTFPTYTEAMWINGYPNIRAVVVTHPQVPMPGGMLPGAIFTVPVGVRAMASADAFRIAYERVVTAHTAQGNWIRKSHEPSA